MHARLIKFGLRLTYRLSKFIKHFESRAVFSLVVVEEGLGVNEHRHNDIALSALDQIVESDGLRQFGLGYIEDLVLDVLNVEA